MRAAGRAVWASSAAGSVLIHAGFIAAALLLMPKLELPPPEPTISIADFATGFAEEVAAPPISAELPEPQAALPAAEPETVARPVESVANALPPPSAVAQPVTSAVSRPVAPKVAVAVEPVVAAPAQAAVARPVESAVSQAVAPAAATLVEPPVTTAGAVTQQAAAPIEETVAAPAAASSVAAAVASQNAAVSTTPMVAAPAVGEQTLAATAPLEIEGLAVTADGTLAAMTETVSAPRVANAGDAAPRPGAGVAATVAPGSTATALAPVVAGAPPTGAGQVAGSVTGAGVASATAPAGSARIAAGAASGVAGAVTTGTVAAGTANTATGATVAAPVAAQPQTLVAAEPEPETVAALPEPEESVAATAPPGVQEMSAFIDSYGEQSCFAAVAETAANGTAELTSYGSAAALEKFAADAKAGLGEALPLDTRVISAGQCWLLDMLGAWRRYWDPQFDIALNADRVASGGNVEGSINNVRGDWLYMVLVDDDGRVSDLANYLVQNGSTTTLNAPVTATGNGGQNVQLLVAIATPTSLVSVDRNAGQTAEQFFAALQDELKKRQIRPQLSITSFSVY